MLDRDTLRTLLSLGALVGIGGLLLAFVEPPGSAEQVISVCSAVIGGTLILIVVLVSRFQRQRGA
ncbi:MAG: hypothetical protein JNL34_06995 [Anaerolineae bacterium]|nr:hypothetical protein [Anaerolineae bacterium]